MWEIPITGRLSVFVFQLLPPSSLFHMPPEGEPIQILFVSIGSNAIQLTLPFPLFLPLERIIGVLIGPLAIQLDALLEIIQLPQTGKIAVEQVEEYT